MGNEGCFHHSTLQVPIYWEVLIGVGVDGVGGNVPLFCCFSSFSSFFFAFLLILLGQEQTTVIYW